MNESLPSRNREAHHITRIAVAQAISEILVRCTFDRGERISID